MSADNMQVKPSLLWELLKRDTQPGFGVEKEGNAVVSLFSRRDRDASEAGDQGAGVLKKIIFSALRGLVIAHRYMLYRYQFFSPCGSAVVFAG